ncbi:MAG: hypothetical protein WAW86_05455 [Gammaproteobacteria bacterium]
MDNLPLEILLRIASSLNRKTLILLSSAISKQMSVKFRSYWFFYKELVDLGIDFADLNEVAPYIADFNNLYQSAIRLPFLERVSLLPWQICCLSNEPRAIKYAKEYYGITERTKDELGRYPQHFFALANRAEKIIISMDMLETRSILRLPDYKGRTMLHYGALSGNKDVLMYMLMLNFTLTDKDYEGRDARHYAAQSASSNQIEFTIFDNNLSPRKKDDFKNTALQCGLCSHAAFFAVAQVEKYADLRKRRNQGLALENNR